MRRCRILLLALATGCRHGGPGARSASGPPRDPHDPDAQRGPLPALADRADELSYARKKLDEMYAHRLDKEMQYGIDEDSLFAGALGKLDAATTWLAYDRVLYDTFAAFHDSHLTYHPPPAAAPAGGYVSWHLGLRTVLGAGEHLYVEEVEPGSGAAAAGIRPGDEVVGMGGVTTAEALGRAVSNRATSRPRAAEYSFARTWTAMLLAADQSPPPWRVVVLHLGEAAPVTLEIAAQRPPPHAPPPAVRLDWRGDVAVLHLRTFYGGKEEQQAIDDALADVRRRARALIIDLRGNRGGYDRVGYRVIGDLAADHPTLGSYRVLVAPDTLADRPMWEPLAGSAPTGGFSRSQAIIVDGLPAGQGFRAPVSVLVDAGCASMCETIADALRVNLHARLLGETTAGSSGAPVTIRLPVSHGSLAIPTWDLLDAEGQPIEGLGVTPDVDAEPTPQALAQGIDLPLEEAVRAVGGPASEPASMPGASPRAATSEPTSPALP